jgi:hypothetical protein
MVQQPVYEIIKKEDLAAAFADSLSISLAEVLERINNLIDLYAVTAQSSLWTWDYTSRWGYDKWW